MDEKLDALGETIAGALAGTVLDRRISHGELSITVAPADIVNAMTFLRGPLVVIAACAKRSSLPKTWFVG